MLHQFMARDFAEFYFIKECFKEVVTWLRLRHPNVLPFIGINRSLFRPRIALLSPWMVNGTVLFYLKTHPSASRIDIASALNS